MSAPEENSTFTAPYRRYALLILTLVYTLNYVDRNLVILLLQPIKDDLHLSDTQLGFITGLAFGLFYATLGLPVARWADRGDRVTLTSLAIGLWGATVMSCLLVGNFFQLVLARIAAAVGESGCMPPTYSLLGDYFPNPAERVRAMAVYWLASPLSSLVSFIIGGWLNARYGWRLTFFFMGVPGPLLAVLVRATIIEPRLQFRGARLEEPSTPGLMPVLRHLWRQRSSRHLGLAYILLLTMALGLAPWYAAFLIRSHGMTTSDVGVYLGVIFGLAGLFGVLLGGYTSARWFSDNEPAQVRLSGFTMACVFPCFVLFLLLPKRQEALVALVPLVVVFTFFLGPTFALMQRLVPNDVRARSVAIVMLLANFVGMGIGPLAVGMLSDLLEPRLGPSSLRYAMLIMSSIALWSAYHFLIVGRTVKKDLSVVADHNQRAIAFVASTT